MLTIRNFRRDDLVSCRELWVQLTEWHRQLYESGDIGGSEPGLQFDALLAQVGEEGVWVAEADGRVVGMVGLIQRGAEAELEPIVVDEAWRRRGVGHKLAEAAVSAAREADVRRLLVRPAARNRRAMRFFHSLGFDILGQLELMMGLAPEDASRWRSGELLADRQFRI